MHGLTTTTIAGVPCALRLTLPAFFAIPAIGDVLQRLASGTFFVDDVRTALRALLPPLEGARLLERLSLSDVHQAALSCALAISRGLSTPDGEDEPKGGDGDDVTLGSVYRTGYAIGLKPREIDELTPWEFAQCVRGWNIAHGGEEEPAAPSQDEVAELFKKYS
ncbi:hypothetical protein [Mesorhizobium sp. DCY119]|uniref:hypothetical protein n=1 Tax=Mesorhizobium sp. DCY119 TaxID=2108445 RepID=UPI000E6D0DC7|nr:hypothetical protein [Mesorhizobium sp. DCY119]RJG44908.1 hypothetical protein D3Y55_11945 [Mesorhizobium sp. DCY119]